MTGPASGEPLTFNVAGLLAEPAGTTRTERIAAATMDPGEGLRLSTPIAGAIRLTRTNRGLLVTGDLTGALAEECSRCLRPVDVPLELRIEEEALPSIDIATGLAVDMRAEPDVLRLTDHHELELEPVVRDAISLAEPIAPLCRPDCPGLCVVCGADLAAGPHGHDDAPIDPRLEALRAFRFDGPAEKD